jgi:flagellar biosynthesis protein FlhG
LANFDFDQAEGLRRMLAGAKPRVVTFLSATPQDDKGAMLVNLCASLTHAGNEVLLVDAGAGADGAAARLGVAGATLQDVARQRCRPEQAITRVPQGFGVLRLGETRRLRADQDQDPALAQALAQAFEDMVGRAGIVVVDGQFEGDRFALAALDDSEIVVQVSSSGVSITAAYRLIKRLSQELGRRPFGILVTGASEVEAKVIYDNMAQAAMSYLALNLTSMGSVPADEYLHRAARLGRAVIDAFPMAGASVAFRRLAGRFSGQSGSSLYRSGSNSHLSA